MRIDMPTSTRWKNLKREIDALREHFLPSPFDPLGVYLHSGRVQAHTRAFIVLSHAEIESYLEEWAKEIARKCEDLWTSSSKVTDPLAYLLVTLSERIELPITLTGSKDTQQRLLESCKELFPKYYKHIKDNHGIKEKNVLALLAPLGVPAAALGSTLLPNLDSFGTLRGTHAHQSAKAVRNVLDPETEYNRVAELANELLALDQWLLGYKRRIR